MSLRTSRSLTPLLLACVSAIAQPQSPPQRSPSEPRDAEAVRGQVMSNLRDLEAELNRSGVTDAVQVRQVAAKAARHGYRKEAVRLLGSFFATQGPTLEGSATLTQKGEILAGSGEHRAAIACFKDALAILDREIERDPKYKSVRAIVQSQIAESYGRIEEFETAIKSAQSVIDEAPAIPGPLVAKAMRSQSLWLRRLGRDEEAGKVLARMIAEYPDDRHVSSHPLGIRLERVQAQHAEGDPNVYAAELAKLWHDPAFESEPMQTWLITSLLDALFRSDTPELMVEEAYNGLERLSQYREEWLAVARASPMPIVSVEDIEEAELQILRIMVSADSIGDHSAALFANRRLAEIEPLEKTRQLHAEFAREIEAKVAAGK